MKNGVIKKIILDSSPKEIEEIIEFCKETLSKKINIKDVLKEKFDDPRYSNCYMIMLAGIYDYVDCKGIGDFNFLDVYEYENILSEVYEKSDNKFERIYSSFDDFEKIDLFIQIAKTEGHLAAEEFMHKIINSKGWPMNHDELENSDGGFDVIWIYNKNTDEIYIESFDNSN